MNWPEDWLEYSLWIAERWHAYWPGCWLVDGLNIYLNSGLFPLTVGCSLQQWVVPFNSGCTGLMPVHNSLVGLCFWQTHVPIRPYTRATYMAYQLHGALCWVHVLE